MSDHLKERYRELPHILLISDDKKCVIEGCDEFIGDRKAYCKKHREDRAEYFRKEYYKQKGWHYEETKKER